MDVHVGLPEFDDQKAHGYCDILVGVQHPWAPWAGGHLTPPGNVVCKVKVSVE